MQDIEYQLKFLLNSVSLKVNSIEEKDDTKMEALMFLKKYKTQKMVYAFVQPGKTGPTVTPVFGVPIDEEATNHTLLYCQIAVGVPLFASKEYAQNCKTPKGYDSFIVSRRGASIKDAIAEAKKSKDYRSYSYVIPDPSRVLVLAEVRFTYDKKMEDRQRNSNLCESCGKKQSTLFCLAEKAAFCGDCDRVFHANAFTQRHERHYFDKVGKKMFLSCKDHVSDVVDYFCLDCCTPLCTKCSILGSHSPDTPNSRHKLLTYIDACNLLQKKAREESLSLHTGKTRAEESLREIEKEIEAFDRSVEEARTKLEYEYRMGMNKLSDIEKRRYQKINARFFESKYLQLMADRAISYPLEVDPSVLVSKWKSIEEINAYVGSIILPALEEEEKLTVRGSISVHALSREPAAVSPAQIDTTFEDSISRKRTEMLLSVARTRTQQ